MWTNGSSKFIFRNLPAVDHKGPMYRRQVVKKTRSVAAGFGRHSMPLPASNDTNSILFPKLRRGRDKTYRRWKLMTLNFDLWLKRVVVLHPCTKFEVRRSCRSEDMAHDVCQH